MLRAWRIVKAKHAATAFSGEGTARHGGRWNSRGVWVVYTSSTQSLAALEILVHLNPLILSSYVAFGIEFDRALVEKFDLDALPQGWRDEPPPPFTKQIGNTWVEESRSAVLELPSVIVPGEPNYLLNPHHRDFRKITIGAPAPFAFDPRLFA